MSASHVRALRSAHQALRSTSYLPRNRRHRLPRFRRLYGSPNQAPGQLRWYACALVTDRNTALSSYCAHSSTTSRHIYQTTLFTRTTKTGRIISFQCRLRTSSEATPTAVTSQGQRPRSLGRTAKTSFWIATLGTRSRATPTTTSRERTRRGKAGDPPRRHQLVRWTASGPGRIRR
jgi:hypothetical protein